MLMCANLRRRSKLNRSIMPRIRMCTKSQIPPGSAVEKRIMARRVALFNDNGQLFAVEGDCKHMKAPLSTGRVQNKTVECPWHFWRYRLDTGVCLNMEKVALKTYVVEEEGDDLYVIIE